jgi:RimJ/RimL family protein N-acetyltransferase
MSASVRLRPIEREDLSFLRDLANDAQVRENVVGWDWPLSLAAQERWFDAGADTMITRRFIVEDDEGAPVGLTGLWDIDWHNRSAMTAIKIGGRPNVRGRGHGFAAIAAIMAFAFNDVGLNRLYTTILSDNEPSRQLFVTKCGWVEEGVLREHVWRNGVFRDVVHVALLRNEYLTWVQK